MTFPFDFLFTGLAVDSEATTSSQIEEMIQELAQQEGLEAPITGMPQESATIEVKEVSTPHDLPGNSPASDPQLGKRILMY